MDAVARGRSRTGAHSTTNRGPRKPAAVDIVFADGKLSGLIRSYLAAEEGTNTAPEGKQAIPGHPPSAELPSPPQDLEVDFEGLLFPLYQDSAKGIPTLNVHEAGRKVCKLSPFSPSFVPQTNPSPATSLQASRFWSPTNLKINTGPTSQMSRPRLSPKLSSVRGNRPVDMTWANKLSHNHASWRVRVDTPVGPGIPSGVDTTLTKVFLGSLAWKTTSMTLYNVFIHFGEIREAAVIYDESGPRPRSKGFGFVTFVSPASASAATMNGNPVIDGRKVDCILAALGTKCKSEKTLPANCKPWLREMMRARKAAERPVQTQTTKAMVVSGNRFTFEPPGLMSCCARPMTAPGGRRNRRHRRARTTGGMRGSPRGTIPGRNMARGPVNV